MKTYTIRPLKWKCNCDDLHEATDRFRLAVKAIMAMEEAECQ